MLIAFRPLRRPLNGPLLLLLPLSRRRDASPGAFRPPCPRLPLLAWSAPSRWAARRIRQCFARGERGGGAGLGPRFALGLAALLLGWPVGMAPLRAATDPPPPGARAPRPADLVILQRRSSVNGEREVGVFGTRADPLQPDLWSVQVWEETDDRVTIATDRIRCSPQAPMRITGSISRLLVRELNPGGAIHDGNRLDHLIWWAVCHPSLAGRDPATLAPEARRLGLSGTLPERQEIVPAPSLRRN